MNAHYPDFLGETAKRIGLRRYPEVRQFVVQHLYADTLRLLLLLHRHVPIDVVIGIGYSGQDTVVQQLREAGIRVVTPSYEALRQTVADELGASLARCRDSGRELLIHEVGGYAIRALHEAFADDIDLVAGAVEITKQGVWVAESLPELRIPQLNCAQTRLKEIEGRMVGDAVAASIDTVLRELGLSLSGRRATLLGYGWVGSGCARGLSARGMQVSVHDSDDIRQVAAAVDGHVLTTPTVSEPAPFLVLGASGHCSIDRECLQSLPDGCFIASGASKDHEIDLDSLRDGSERMESIHPHVDACHMRDGRCLYLINQGFPVNFIASSVPDEIVEFLFAELIMLVPELLDKRPSPGIWPLSEERERLAARIWLQLR
ncbi:MAG: hypothetical protein CSB44_06670 [Gammaproteobacteria bacterium]|nr:MAG: hypothetical protein CSB44_06670 [Gammaproteobacteria bacterium]